MSHSHTSENQKVEEIPRPLIQTENLSRIYNPNQPSEITALDNVSVSVAEGEVVAIVGPSGSGKSTLLHLLGGMDAPSGGNIWLKGQEIGQLPERKLADIRREEIGFIFQSYYLIDTLTVLDNVLVPLIPYGIKAPQRAFAKELLSQAGLEDRMDSYPRQLSGGEQQRVAICRALINRPSVILADEPTGNLDSKTGDSIIALLKSINTAQGTTILIVTHDSKIAGQTQRIIELEDGKAVKNSISDP
ncbi:MAG: ABC transporter ATP-binding protein [Candidatus Hodarchaeales archaeon]|jgi:putative ABC transport system ATP-binding protein